MSFGGSSECENLLSFHGFISLMDMIKFHGKSLYELARFLEGFETLMAEVASREKDISLDPEAKRFYSKRFKEYAEFLNNHGLEFSAKEAHYIVAEAESAKSIHIHDAISLFSGLHRRILDELTEISLWRVPRDNLKFLKSDPFDSGLAPFNPHFRPVSLRFGLANKDIAEAGKCLAFGRHTASVFHLMRVMEVGLRALGASLNDPSLDPKTNPSWGKILARGDKEMQKHLADRCPEWRADENFFSTAQANLRAVKDAWRNPTMHIERNYDPDEAEDVWNTVRAFMRHLSQKLSA
jgi:hypothetical protein